jgi:hypothetical protein
VPKEAFQREQMKIVYSAKDAVPAANRLAEDAKTLSRDANISARAASASADQSERNAKNQQCARRCSLAVATAALIASA